ncbi:MAG: hypothetical protein HYZ40_09805 [Rhodospirillales bacterium]|nr:hypothetical protein [Rhodospirillales bacterium]
MRRLPTVLLAALLALPAAAVAQDSDQNVSNDPLTPLGAVQVQNYFQPFLNGRIGSGADQLNVRGVLPHEAFGLPQFARVTLPVMASAWGPNGSTTGLGDITLFDLFVHTIDKVRLGVGPLAVAPTATSTALGEAKWQVGGQGIASARHAWGLTAGFFSYQQSFDGLAQTIQLQPLLFYNLDDGYYLRSSGIVSFDLAHRTTVVPVGIGLGRTIPLASGRILNLFVEPQYSAIRNGEGVPTFQLYAGINVQFPLGGASR